jgi:hypothetical protein
MNPELSHRAFDCKTGLVEQLGFDTVKIGQFEMIERSQTLLDTNGMAGVRVFERPRNDAVCAGREIAKAIKSVDDRVDRKNSGVKFS